MSAITKFCSPTQRAAFLAKHPIILDPKVGGGSAAFTYATNGGGGLMSREGIADALHPHRRHYGATRDFAVRFRQRRGLYFELPKEATKSVSQAGTTSVYAGCHELQVKDTEARGRRRCYFLPWREDEITYMRIGTWARFFFTGPLSGCQVYIAEHGGRLWVFHANSNRMGVDLRKPNESAKYMDTLYTLARPFGARLLARLGKDDYVAYSRRQLPAGRIVEHETPLVEDYLRRKTTATTTRMARTDVELIQTYAFVFGYRDGHNWSFWAHVVGMASYSRPGLRSHVTRKFKVVLGQLPVPAATEVDLLI